MHYILALGNPGEKYKYTRHNAGFLVIDKIFFGVDFKYNKFAEAEVATDNVFENEITILKPQTFMNLSGKTADYFAKKDNNFLKNLIVIHDDVYLPLGDLKISFGKSDGGHNGVKSLIEKLRTQDFIRIRIGVGQSVKPFNLEAFVLEKFHPEELEIINKNSIVIKEIIESIYRDGIEKTMNKYN